MAPDPDSVILDLVYPSFNNFTVCNSPRYLHG